MSIALDIAAALSAVIWPVIVLVIFLAYRTRIPSLVEGLAGRISKFEFAGFSLELAQAKRFVPVWDSGPAEFDLRHRATAVQISDSSRAMFLAQLHDEGTGDFAEINLGTGEEWLTSRLFIMAILFARMKGIRCFVFLDKSGSVRKHLVGWAEPEKLRWALANKFPWLEQAYADAYAAMNMQRHAVVVSHRGRLGYAQAPPDANASIDLLKEFLQRVQKPGPLPNRAGKDWVVLESAVKTLEHANWVNADLLEEILGDDLITVAMPSADLRSKNTAGQLSALLSMSEQFVPVVGNDRKFEYLVKRDVLMDQVGKMLASPP